MMDLIAAKAASDDPRAASLEGASATTVPLLESSNLAELVALFGGPDRLRASNALLALYSGLPNETVAALVEAVVPESPNSNSYRVNLYVVFTLARLRPNWIGSEAQRQTIEGLRDQGSYSDATFRRRVDQALENFES